MLFHISLLISAVITCSLGAQCAQDPDFPCVFTCNGTQFNLTDVFDYPIAIEDPKDKYEYWWSPCKPYKCPDEITHDKDSAICQRSDRYYNCGQLQNAIFLLNGYYPQFQWKIQYTYGTDWRIAEFNFIVDPNKETPTITFTGEDPYLQYNFYVVGKCIGQAYCKEGIPNPLLEPQRSPLPQLGRT